VLKTQDPLRATAENGEKSNEIENPKVNIAKEEKLTMIPEEKKMEIEDNKPQIIKGESNEVKKEGNEEKEGQKIEILNRFPANIEFRVENYIQEEKSKGKYNTILCLSTTKWIHFHFGDLGIKRLFNKVYSSLTENGIFILEPQE